MEQPRRRIGSSRKEDAEWVSLESHPVFAGRPPATASTAGGGGGGGMSLAAWHAASSRLYLWDPDGRCVHRLSLRFSSPSCPSDTVVVEAASPSEKLVPDVQTESMIQHVSLNEDGSSLLLHGRDTLIYMRFDEWTSSKADTLTCRTCRVGSQMYFGRKNNLKILHVSWHPYSNNHLGVLTSDAVFRIFDLSSDFEQPEQEYYLQVAEPEICSNFCSVCPIAFSFGGQHLWERFSVFILFSDGSIYVLCPIVPFGSFCSLACIEEIYKDYISFGLKPMNSKLIGSYNMVIAWLIATFPELTEQLSGQGMDFLSMARPYAIPNASISLQGPLKVCHGTNNDSDLEYPSNEGRAVGLLYSCTGKDSVFVTAWSTGKVQIDALADEIGPSWKVDDTPHVRMDPSGRALGIAMICEASENELSIADVNLPVNQTTSTRDSDYTSCSRNPPSVLRLAIIDLALPHDVINDYSLSMCLDPIDSDRFYCLHGDGADLIALKFLPFSNMTAETNKAPRPPLVHPILSTDLGKSSSPLLCGFVIVDDSYGLSKIVAITSSYECVLLDAKGPSTIWPLHSLFDEKAAVGLLGNDVPKIISKEILSGPKIMLVPPTSLRSLNANSIEGRSILHQYIKILHENYVTYAHKVYIELKDHGDHMKTIIDNQHKRLHAAKQKIINYEAKNSSIDARMKNALDAYGTLEQRLRGFKALRGSNKKPLSRAERDFKDLLARFTDHELVALQSSIDALNARLRRSQSSPSPGLSSRVVPGRSGTGMDSAFHERLRASLEKLSIANEENIDKTKLIENELKRLGK